MPGDQFPYGAVEPVFESACGLRGRRLNRLEHLSVDVDDRGPMLVPPTSIPTVKMSSMVESETAFKRRALIAPIPARAAPAGVRTLYRCLVRR